MFRSVITSFSASVAATSSSRVVVARSLHTTSVAQGAIKDAAEQVYNGIVFNQGGWLISVYSSIVKQARPLHLPSTPQKRSPKRLARLLVCGQIGRASPLSLFSTGVKTEETKQKADQLGADLKQKGNDVGHFILSQLPPD